MNETRIIIFAMQWTSLGSCSNSFTKATSLCGHVSFELKRRNGTKKKDFVSRSANPNNTDFRKNNMANRVFLKKAESDAQQDVWTIIQKNLQWKRLLLLLVTQNPWKHHLVPKATSCANPNTFYQLSQCLARARFGIIDLAQTLRDSTGDVWHSPLSGRFRKFPKKNQKKKHKN